MRLHALNVARALDVPVADDRDADDGFHLGDGIPVCLAAVVLLFCPAVHGDERATVLFHNARDQLVCACILPAQAHLAGHRHTQEARQRAEQTRHLQRRTHHPHAGAAAGHALRGAAHVDVDDVRSQFLDLEGGPDQRIRVIAIELEDHRPL